MKAHRTYRLIAGTAVAATALGLIASPADAYVIDAPQPQPAPTAQPGPDNPQARPDGSVSTATVPAPDPSAWTTTDLRPTHAAPAPTAAATAPTVRRAQRKATPATPRAPRAPRVAQGKPVGGTWYVGPGDSLWSIARAHGTTVAALVAANVRRHPGLATNPDLIRDGWTIRIPKAVR